MPDTTALKSTDASATAVDAPPATDTGPAPGKPRSLWSDAWHDLRRNPLFIVSMVLILLLAVMSIFPGLFTSASPREANLAEHYLQHPNWGHFFAPDWLGYDGQGRSIYARLVYGARASITVGVVVTLAVTITGLIIGMLAGYFGGWIDTILSRITDVFFGVPFIVGAMVILTSFEKRSVWVVILSLAFLGWTSIARVARGSVITIKQSDYVVAAKALGASTTRILTRHILPNAIAPVIVVATIALGGYIAAEATLSFLGIGLAEPTVSWGIDVSAAKDQLRNAPYVLVIPSVMVSITVLSFLMFGDAVRNALDPKMR
ncbi:MULTISPECIES: ABC transporter permease [Streptomyces]|uniref:Peptide ABC transporter permease protein n=1 Tax=Streptomyces griseus subsp. griseus (strain JCM 4626 / CBS 651.72 / NBRC 13350 / KCC S-0626 / ISP 5235) TaxID=455632 RepID=B1W1M0_STRGG|nr:ABC transporter permease [Streptomyces griseus]MYR10706.1 ABC transporter permease subunit [Streptomyces sp. SID724]MBW3704895.1 ABC transporter permease [Streptomyces griseus]NEB57996.1 ABC transporter permease [Streptomyces griseus]SEE92120.1 peptide/nickel transport system permease protein [Streptomyces griseus]SQA23944.1 peptide ABC transporter permease [Streptomyces griseus]